jgi:hypothetical protein
MPVIVLQSQDNLKYYYLHAAVSDVVATAVR